jgi:indolepyruvate ferredoxin oxidoreductase
MAYKDEYEVARLYTSGDFEERLNATFEGDFTLKFNLAPPLLAKRTPGDTSSRGQYGAWIWPFKMLARLKFLRGTAFDIFGRTEERRMERQLIEDYRTSMEAAVKNLNASNLSAGRRACRPPGQIRASVTSSLKAS